MIRRTLVVGAAAVTLIAAWGVARQANLNPAPAAQTGSPRVVELSQIQTQVGGKPVAYLFTATGCSSCVAEVEAMQAAARGHAGLQLVGIDMSAVDSPADLSWWLQASGLGSTAFVWTIDKDGALVQKFGVTALGNSVLLDSSGRVRFFNQTSTDPSVLAKQLAQLT